MSATRGDLSATRTGQMTMKSLKQNPHRTMYYVKRTIASPVEKKSASGPPVEYTRTATYQGDWVGDSKQGFGIQNFKDGSRYEGFWYNNQQEGRGVRFVVRGSSVRGAGRKLEKEYDGDWVAGKKEGHGTCYYANGDLYEGEWVGGVRHGHGTLRYASGDVYTGGWVAGHRDGSGRLTCANGDCYSGGWSQDTKHGSGQYTYASKRMVYTGEWVNDAAKCGEMRRLQDGEIDAAAASAAVGAPHDDIAASAAAAVPIDPVAATRNDLPELYLADPYSVLQTASSAAHSEGSDGGGAGSSLGGFGSTQHRHGGTPYGPGYQLPPSVADQLNLSSEELSQLVSAFRVGEALVPALDLCVVSTMDGSRVPSSQSMSAHSLTGLSHHEQLQHQQQQSQQQFLYGVIPADTRILGSILKSLGVPATPAEVDSLLNTLLAAQEQTDGDAANSADGGSYESAGWIAGPGAVSFPVFAACMAGLRAG